VHEVHRDSRFAENFLIPARIEVCTDSWLTKASPFHIIKSWNRPKPIRDASALYLRARTLRCCKVLGHSTRMSAMPEGMRHG
jgi:hypothetical protein